MAHRTNEHVLIYTFYNKNFYVNRFFVTAVMCEIHHYELFICDDVKSIIEREYEPLSLQSMHLKKSFGG